MIRAAIVSYLIDVCLDLLESDLVVKFTPVEFRFRLCDCVEGGNYWITFNDVYRHGMRKSGIDNYLTNSDRLFFHVTGVSGSGFDDGRVVAVSGYLYRDSGQTNGIRVYINDLIIESIVPA